MLVAVSFPFAKGSVEQLDAELFDESDDRFDDDLKNEVDEDHVESLPGSFAC